MEFLSTIESLVERIVGLRNLAGELNRARNDVDTLQSELDNFENECKKLRDRVTRIQAVNDEQRKNEAGSIIHVTSEDGLEMLVKRLSKSLESDLSKMKLFDHLKEAQEKTWPWWQHARALMGKGAAELQAQIKELCARIAKDCDELDQAINVCNYEAGARLQASLLHVETKIDIVIAAGVKTSDPKSSGTPSSHEMNRTPDNHQDIPYEIGLDAPVDKLKCLLLNEQKVAISGIGGMGKTTLAKKLFNSIAEDYDYTCFVDTVKEKLLKHAIVENLKREIMANLYAKGKKWEGKDIYVGWKELQGKKVLLNLDDVDSSNHLLNMSGFSDDSRLVVTTRNRGIVRDFKIHLIDQLGFENSKRLFCSHAFKDQLTNLTWGSMGELEKILNDLVRKCDGMPLTIQAIGNALHKVEDLSIWEEMKQKLEDVGSLDGSRDEEQIWQKLIISFDMLNKEAQEMFLDAAIFLEHKEPESWFGSLLKGTRLDYFKSIYWKAIYKTPDMTWQHLIERNLICERLHYRGVWIHEHYRDITWKIACSQDKDYKTHLRISIQISDDNNAFSDVVSMIHDINAQGNFRAKALVLRNDFPRSLLRNGDGNGRKYVPFDVTALSRFPDLRLLVLEGFSFFNGSEWNLPRHLVVLRIEDSIIPTPVFFPSIGSRLNSLVDLKLGISSLTPVDPGQEAKRRKVDKPVNLGETLHSQVQGPTIFMCDLLHPKSCNLSKLRMLDIDCSRLGNSDWPSAEFWNEFAEHLGSLSSLEHLAARCWHGFKSFREPLEKLGSLRTLLVQDCHEVVTWPSFNRLPKLERIEIDRCDGLTNLSPGIPKSLKHLSITGCNYVTEWWNSGLEEETSDYKLQSLKMSSCCRLSALPTNFGRLHALQTLTIWSCEDLVSLPDSFGQLCSLQWLNVTECTRLTTLPSHFGSLLALKMLTIDRCDNLLSLPDSFGNLCSLKLFTLYQSSKLIEFPPNFGNLSALEELVIGECDNLKSLPDSFAQLCSLKKLTLLKCKKLIKLPPKIGDLRALKILRVKECDNLNSLPDSFGQLCSLKKFNLKVCNNLTNLPPNFGDLTALEDLVISRCDNLISLPDSFGQLCSLKTLTLLECKKLVILPPKFGDLRALKILRVEECDSVNSLPDSFGQLCSLKKFNLNMCNKLTNLPLNFGDLTALEDLVISRCDNLESLPDSLGQLSSLKKFTLLECKKLIKLPFNFGDLPPLKYLKVQKCDKLIWLPHSLKCLPSQSRVAL